MKTKFIIAFLVIVFFSCNNKDQKADVKKVKEREYFDKGAIDPSETTELKLVKIAADPASDASVHSLRADNFHVDQFSCVVEGSGYYRLTNMHRSNLITGCVKKSWLFEGKTIYKHDPFTLRPGDWQTFGCFYVTMTQPISFEICSFFGTTQRCVCPND